MNTRISTTIRPQAARDAVKAVNAGMAQLPPQVDTPEARVALYAIGFHESNFSSRVQILNGGGRGPAMGFWQFEKNGGCAGVLRHNASRYWMYGTCWFVGVEPKPAALWAALETNDMLAAVAARLLMFTDRPKLPAVGDSQGVQALYLRVWRPGKPGLDRWASSYAKALALHSQAPSL